MNNAGASFTKIYLIRPRLSSSFAPLSFALILHPVLVGERERPCMGSRALIGSLSLFSIP